MKEQLFFCEPEHLLSYLTKTENATAEEIQLATDRFGNFEPESILSIEGNTARIKITGMLSRKGPSLLARLFGYGGTSYFEVIDSIKAAEKDPSVEKIILDMDTPGGEVAGVDQVWQALAKCPKKTIAMNHNMIASAGYYIASACDKILAIAPTNATGSIGVIITAVSYKKLEEKWGIKEVTIVSRNAPNKAPDITTKKGRDILQERADELESVFMDRIAEGRGVTVEKIKSDYGQGGLLLAEKALSAGMIDGLEYKGKKTVQSADFDNSAGMADETTTPEGEHMEETMDKLMDILASNPGAKAEYDLALVDARAEGVEAGKKEIQARVNKIAPIMASDVYDKVLKTQAQKALDGELSIEAFESVVAMEDMRLERAKSEDATDETKDIGETTAENHNVNNSGIAETETDVVAMAQSDMGAK